MKIYITFLCIALSFQVYADDKKVADDLKLVAVSYDSKLKTINVKITNNNIIPIFLDSQLTFVEKIPKDVQAEMITALPKAKPNQFCLKATIQFQTPFSDGQLRILGFNGAVLKPTPVPPGKTSSWNLSIPSDVPAGVYPVLVLLSLDGVVIFKVPLTLDVKNNN